MQFNSIFKYIWWVIVICLGGYIIYLRFDHITGSNAGIFDVFLVAIIAGLMLIPFFTEMDFLGVKLKQEIATIKTEVNEDLREMREIVRNAIDINNHNRFSPSIYFGNNPSPPPDNQLNNIEEFIRTTMNQILEQNNVSGQPNANLEVPEENKLLFAVRFNIEREIRRIWTNRFSDFNEEKFRHISVTRMVNDLIKHEILPPTFNGVIREIYAVCSPAVHGEEPTIKQVDFIKDVAQEVISTLKVIR